MYRISEQEYAIEVGDNIVLVRDGGGNLDILIGEKEAFKDPETGPRVIEKGEQVVITIMPKVQF